MIYSEIKLVLLNKLATCLFKEHVSLRPGDLILSEPRFELELPAPKADGQMDHINHLRKLFTVLEYLKKGLET